MEIKDWSTEDQEAANKDRWGIFETDAGLMILGWDGNPVFDNGEAFMRVNLSARSDIHIPGGANGIHVRAMACVFSAYVGRSVGAVTPPCLSEESETEGPETPLRAFTVFCQRADGKGTTWIDCIHNVADEEEAKKSAILRCADDWDWCDHPHDIRVLGVVAGNVDILEWNDLDEQGGRDPW